MKFTSFKYVTYTILGIVIILAIWVFIARPLYKAHQYKKQDATYTLLQAFNQYEDKLFARTALNKKIQQANDAQKSTLLQEIPTLEKNLATQSKALDSALAQVNKYYPSDSLLNKRIAAFQTWKNQSEAKISASTDNLWDLTFLKLQIGIDNAIDKAETGYEHPVEARNQKIMSLVPAAEEALKKHPNDQRLCTVMQQPLAANPRLTAQQIAFFNLGDQYCPKYYANPASWGGWGTQARVVVPIPSLEGRMAYPEEKAATAKTDEESASLNQKYGSLPYPQYYRDYVLPQIPQAIQKFQDPKQNVNLCFTSSLISGPRNPEQDALRIAFLQVGKQYCSSEALKQDYYTTGVFCLTYCEFLCSPGMTCDCVERCKKTPGVLFKDNS